MNRKIFWIVVLICAVLCSCNSKTMSRKDVGYYARALKYGDLETVEKYYKKFGDVVLNNFGIPDVVMINSLEGVLFYNNYDIAKFLLDNGADPNIVLPSGSKLIYSLVSTDNIDGLKFLSKYDVDFYALAPNEIDNLMTYASAVSTYEMIAYLRKYFDINVKVNNGQTPLFSAVLMGQKENVEYLVVHNCDINAVDLNNETPLMYAIRAHEVKIAEYLILHGADISIVRNDGSTALSLAEEAGLQIRGLNVTEE